MDQLTDFGKKVIITLVVIAAAALLFAGYKLIYLPLAAVESRYWNILINVLAFCLATLMVGITGWVILRLAGNLKRNLAPHGEAVFQKTKEGKEFVGWRMPDGTFTPKPLPGFGSQATSISLHMGHQGYPPKYLLDAPVEEAEEKVADPQALRPVTFREVASQIPPGKQLLGVRPDGSLRLGTLADDMMTTLYLGKSGSGKTVSVASELGMEVRNGALLMVADPHLHKPDSLARKIAPLADNALWPGTRIVSMPEEIAALLGLARQELARRRAGGLYDGDLIIVLEEYGFLYDDPDLRGDLVALSKELTREGRGFRMYGKFATQRLAGGMAAQIRRLAQSYVIHRSDYDDAHAIVHDADLAKQAMKLAPGSSIVVDAYGDQELLQRSYVTAEDITLLAQQAPQRRLTEADRESARRAWESLFTPPAAAEEPLLPPLPMKGDSLLFSSSPGAQTPVRATIISLPEKRREEKKKPRCTEEERAAILAWHEAGYAASAIASKMGKSSNFYYVIRDVLEEAASAAEEEQDYEQH